MSDVRETALLVIGGGPGGYPAALHAADSGIKVTLVDEGAKLGGVCLNRGCIPSKALLHTAKIIREAHEMAAYGVTFGEPKLDLAKLRDFVQAKVVGKLTGGIGQLTKGRGVDVVKGRAVFTSPNTVEVTGDQPQTIKFQNCIIATGSLPAIPKQWQINDDRVMDSTGALLLPDVPKKLLVIGGGYIGLEIGSVYAALGSKVTVVEALERLLFMADKDLVDPLERKLKTEFEAIYTSTKVMGLEATPEGIVVKLEGAGAPASLTFDRVLISVGRRPNSAGLGLDKAGVNVTDRGFIPIDKQRRTNVPHIFAIGDVGEEPGLAHKATAEARVAVEVLHGEPAEWNPRAIPAVIFTDPEIAWAGITQKEAEEKKVPHEVLTFPWAASGRAVSIARTEGRTKMIVDPETKRVLGVGIVGAGAGEMIAEGVLAIEMGAVARDVLESIHPHPTLSETVMESAELAYGAATHVAKPRKAAK
ncbi:Dihydrolipoyl dehydrogenase [Gemmata obscuriglobus]|uniref:Dihydrolipoyl dehydrogenase n=1 Tax=Gemmata obscuriglobus TaxID=114 RepID=A0A2Z3H8K8_9BACT|nr:dihydrolipoyl dehydrogenase [Gemmata obscuriglobus]AWM42048.1 dihydrolipoyl dehydrogenase [Gemmata obscuriglobus]QEG31958.1 Dihydrolipoyl dehydrogenase [Gemmata obscuriglobus]VTS11308.1 dihydrolipoamide dehydrogenase : Dihydrolipoyl dehydrogenase OS=Planctomyces brasiliensis (strain ATCC 49424 / DSM 5305 / JCM 21570 / NBRC 103401 / IFAM 1448) GN=Plabr_4534 PE=3 SV=1: Pyr_redox_2: Pyr_redox: Pyr_redox_dim [Gemmata obscuriglobus UQM 2246]